ncbi:hypothetical protein LM599_04940 [Candidatus Acetothermia bacterium]|nr:hypothetical protein [Candidatus Acetothermia bacterium]MCI2427624.1 hypothetical protein [Candidatus Acetothermia bacterium]MCI2428473.1 hypothetical protein [Candidatus Acetothermia bacterium]
MDKIKVQQIFTRYVMWMWVPLGILFLLMIINRIAGYDILSALNYLRIAGIPLVSTNATINFTGFAGVGLISVGGLAVGAVALGGAAVGLIAVGGAAVGMVAIGGGAMGLIAIGGGAVGLISVNYTGGSIYVLTGERKGWHVLRYNRQDEQAVSFFCRYLPRLRNEFNKSS